MYNMYMEINNVKVVKSNACIRIVYSLLVQLTEQGFHLDKNKKKKQKEHSQSVLNFYFRIQIYWLIAFEYSQCCIILSCMVDTWTGIFIKYACVCVCA